MTYFFHFLAGIALSISSLFGIHHAAVSPSAQTVVTASSTTSVSTAIQQAVIEESAEGTAPAKPASKPSVISSITSFFGGSSAPVQPSPATPASPAAPSPASAPAATPTPAPTGSAKVEQTQVTSTVAEHTNGTGALAVYSYFTLNGEASNALTVQIELVPASYSSTDWDSVMNSDAAYGDSENVLSGDWASEFDVVPSGNYKVLVFDSETHDLLSNSSLQVNSPESIPFEVDTASLTLGVGQTATAPAIFTIKLVSVSDSGGTPTAQLQVSSSIIPTTSYTASTGTQLPSTGTGFYLGRDFLLDLNVKVTNVSASGKSVTMVLTEVPKLPTEK